MKTQSQYPNHKKAQAAIEFLIIIGFALFFFTIFLMTIQISTNEKTREKQNLIIINFAKSIQDELNIALEASNGYERNFNLPEKIGTLDYTLQLIDQSIYITVDNEKYALSLPAPEINGELMIGQKNTIKKINSKIYLNEEPN